MRSQKALCDHSSSSWEPMSMPLRLSGVPVFKHVTVGLLSLFQAQHHLSGTPANAKQITDLDILVLTSHPF